MGTYRTGTVTVSGEQQIVIGSGTAFLANVSVGDLFKKTSQNVLYEIASVDSDTQLTLASSYAGSGESGCTYSIVRDFTPNFELPEIWAGDKDWPYTLTRALRLIDIAMSNSIAEPSDTITAAENLSVGNTVYYTSEGKAAKSNANSVLTMPVMGIVSPDAISINVEGAVLLRGVVHLHDLAPGWTKGGLVYASKTAGGMTQDVSAFTTGDQVQVLGFAMEDDILYFNPSYVLVEIA